MVALWIATFLVSLAVALVSSLMLARILDRVGSRLGCTDAITGVLTALGADSPEISTAAVAVLTHQTDIGVGVVLGSNVFNLAGLLGISALITGAIRVGRGGALVEGIPAILIATVAVALIAVPLNAWLALVLVVAIVVPYLWLSSIDPASLERGAPRSKLRHRLALAVAEEERDAAPDHHEPPARGIDLALLLPALGLVVAASVGMVEAAQHLGDRWGISPVVSGTLILAMLTSIPNSVAAIRLSRHGRGAAVVAETFNSNSANILAGLCLPAAILGLGNVSHDATMTGWWFLVMTIVTVGLLWLRGGLHRFGGWVVILSYAAFVLWVLR